MAKIGNETRLIIKLAKERMSAAPKLAEEIDFLGSPGNHPENLSWSEAVKAGYYVGRTAYEGILEKIVEDLEGR